MRDGGDDVAILHARLAQSSLIEAGSGDDGTVEVATEIRESVGVLVDDADIVAIVGKHACKLRTDSSTPDNDYIAQDGPLYVTRTHD